MTFWKVFSLSEIALNIILSFIFLKKKFTSDTYRFNLTRTLWTLILGDVSSATLIKTFKACSQSPASFSHLLALCTPKIYFSKVPPLFKPLYTIHLLDHSCLPPRPMLKLATSYTIPYITLCTHPVITTCPSVLIFLCLSHKTISSFRPGSLFFFSFNLIHFIGRH